MRWEIVVTATAAKTLRETKDQRIQGLICKRIDRLSKNPEKQGKALVGELKTFRSARAVGQRYRIIYRIKKEKGIVFVIAVGIRKQGSKKDIYMLAKKLLRQNLLLQG